MFKPNYATYGFSNGYWGAFKGLFNKAQEFADGAMLGYTREPYPTVSFVTFFAMFFFIHDFPEKKSSKNVGFRPPLMETISICFKSDIFSFLI